MPDDIESSFQAAINAGKINGGIICASNTEGTFTYNQAIGERTLLSGEKHPLQLDDIIYLASGTKILTTIAALQCVDDNLLSLDGDLSAIAPDLTSKQILTGFSEDGETPILEPTSNSITLEMLLSHSAGLDYYFMNPLIEQWREKFAKPKEGDKKNVEELFCYPLSYQPGQGWMYGPTMDWAGRIVERVTGLSLGERMQQRLFDRLGINDAQFFPVSREDLRERLVDLNPDDPDALGLAVLGGSADMNTRGRGDFGGHGLFMSAASFAKILQSILKNDGKLLKSETVDEMFRHRLGPEATASHQAALASAVGPFFRIGVDAQVTKCGFGLGGLLTLEDIDGWYGERTLSWGGGLTLTWFIDRKNGICGVGAVQATLPLDMEAATSLKQVFRRDMYRKHTAWKESQ